LFERKRQQLRPGQEEGCLQCPPRSLLRLPTFHIDLCLDQSLFFAVFSFVHTITLADRSLGVSRVGLIFEQGKKFAEGKDETFANRFHSRAPAANYLPLSATAMRLQLLFFPGCWRQKLSLMRVEH
jgi:hypothetical protein